MQYEEQHSQVPREECCETSVSAKENAITSHVTFRFQARTSERDGKWCQDI
jgi:hypothetical protein